MTLYFRFAQLSHLKSNLSLSLCQVARTISNMQQQIQQHQRQLAQALLMKQQHQASSSHSYPSLGKPNLDTFPGNSQASTGLSMSDLHTKEPHASPSSFSAYPLCKKHLLCTWASIAQ